jgi:signal transduction histidine kinase/DNA-binding response OmpR family regulator/ligand-binding sensor domain-containing protein
LGTSNGLFKLNLNTYTSEKIEFEKTFEVTEVIFDSDKKHLWIAGWEAGLTRLNVETLAYERYSLNTNDPEYKSSQNSTRSLLLDSSGRLWIGTWNGGLYSFNKYHKTFDKVDIKPSTSSEMYSDFDIILDIFEDRDNNIWIGTDSGGLVFIGSKKTFQGISLSANPNCGLENFYINAMFETPDNTLWVGTRGGGLYKTKDKKIFERIPTKNETFESLIIKEIYQIDDTILCVSTGTNVYYIDLYKKHILRLVDNDLLSGIKKITTIRKFENHALIGTQQNGFYFLPNYFHGAKEIIHFGPKNNEVLKNERITIIEKDLRDNIWVGTYKGVYLFDIHEKTISNVVLDNGTVLNSEMVSCWAQTTDSAIWMGTPKGLIKLTQSNAKTYSSTFFYNEKEFPFKFVRRILPDNENNIWLSTNSGLVKMNIFDYSLSSFDKSDGLIGSNYSEDIGYKNQDGILYFGGANGFNYFNPSEVTINKKIPPLVFTKFKTFNQEIKPLQEVGGNVILPTTVCLNPTVDLSYKDREFTIEFAALNYTASKKNNYEYKLDGYDSDWISAGTKRTVTYNNLPGGNYKFMVKGSNNNNVWNEEPIILGINIKPAPWKTWYAVLFYIAFIWVMVWLITRNAIKQVRLNSNLEMEKLKNEQVQQLNEMKLRFFTNISHEFRTPLTMILGPVKEMLKANPDNPKLNVAYKNSKRLMGLVNQLLEFRSVETDNISLKVSENNVANFVNEICLSFEELANINDIQFEKIIDITTSNLWFDIDKIEIVLNNIISNAFKYAGAGSAVKVLIDESEQHINFHIIDNGTGIGAEELGKVFLPFYQSKNNKKLASTGIGLNLSKKMVELHSGNIKVESIPNEKTVFTVQLQKGKNHFQDEVLLDTQVVKPFLSSKQGLLSQLKIQNESNETGKKEMSLLIVEDNVEILGYLKELFKNEFNIFEATDGLSAYKSALETTFDIIISDVMMPEMDGMEMCQKLKSDVQTSHIPIILLTAKSASQFRIEGLEHGADAYFSKPFDPDELKMQVHSILESRKKVREKFSKAVLLEPTELEIAPYEEEFLKKIIKIVEENIENAEFTSEELAQQIGMSTASLYRKLKSVVGQSSNELIRSIRLKRAAQLLKNSNNTVSEITYMVGFSDVKYFRKCFQKQFDKTPTNYRKA